VCGGPARNCSDGIACTADTCNESTDRKPRQRCAQQRQYCDGAEVCNPATGCGWSADRLQRRARARSTPATSRRIMYPRAQRRRLNDLLYCNGVETCSPASGQGPLVYRGDGIACTVDVRRDGRPVHARPNHSAHQRTALGDGSATSGRCEAGPPIDCGDGVACTTDSCNEATDQRNHAPTTLFVATVVL
jgi:hypothetical protein